MNKTVYMIYVVAIVAFATAILQAYDNDDRGYHSSSSSGSRSGWSSGAPRSK